MSDESLDEYRAILEFNAGYKDGWDDVPLDPKRPLIYRNAYANAKKARAEAEFYAGKRKTK